MRKVILFMHMSLDGFVAGSNNELDWATVSDDSVGKYLLDSVLPEVDTMLLGRNLFQGFQSYWPAAAENPDTPPEMADFARWIVKTNKVVFSKTLETPGWENSVLAKGDLAEEVARLKAQPGGHMIVYGGAQFAAAMVKAGLVDEYRIKLEPAALGTGKALFGDLLGREHLELTDAKGFKSGVVGLTYQRKVIEA